MTREAAAHGLSMYTHLLQLSADRSLLCHFADVHEFKMQCRKRHANATSQTVKRRDIKQRHKAATFAFRAVKQLLTLLGSLMASIQSPEDLVDKQCKESSALEARTMPVRFFEPLCCGFEWVRQVVPSYAKLKMSCLVLLFVFRLFRRSFAPLLLQLCRFSFSQTFRCIP